MANPITVDNDDAARALANGHPKSQRAPLRDPAPVLPGSPGTGAAPGANGPPTTGPMGPTSPISAC